MRDMVACFSDHAIRVSETTCSSSTYTPTTQPPPPTPTAIAPASQTSATSLYKLPISATKHLLIAVTWTHQTLTITSGENPSTAIFKLNPFKKKLKKGVKSIEVNGSNIEISWDLSDANYGGGAEPRDGYYVVIMVDKNKNPGLVLGDLHKLESGASMVCRREEYRGGGFFHTRVRFSEGGGVHEIGIRVGEEGLQREPWMAVSVDRKRVMRVKKLQWNFRGNGMIWVEGVMVDLYWDLYEWLEEEGSGVGVFMFKRRRCGVEKKKKVWLQEKMVGMEEEEDDGGCEDFSLMIYASKTKLALI